ncbi:hypothetical protein AB833_12310 [Chromatiales bacterium (ex Bugula neritina AB1)]|nr:hypothetical protein AB833_12310 [Chromatiales bacterium (ex Bugula neritina AB1)]
MSEHQPSYTPPPIENWAIAKIVIAQAHIHTDKTAIEFTDGACWSYSDCLQNALHAAGQFERLGIKRGDAVALMIDEPEAFCRLWLGLSMLGATTVAINTSMQGAPLKHQLVTASVAYTFTDSGNHPIVANLQHTSALFKVDDIICSDHPALPVDQVSTSNFTDTACVMFTSGTSGPSKGVVMPEAHCVLFAIGTIENYRLTPDDCFYICLPLFHANGLFMQLLACMLCGAKAVVRPRFSASQWLNDIRHYNATHTNMLGAVASFIVAQPATELDTQHKLRVIGAAPLPAAAETAFRTRFAVPSVLPLYGMTEVNIPLYGSLNESAPGTCGKLYSRYFEVEIRDPETDEPVTQGNIGEIMVRPKQPYGFMSSYAGMPAKTLEAWRNFWFHTGDAGFINEQQQFVFIDRIKDCIRRRGENISSYEVEQAFLNVDGVAEAAAYAVPADGGDGMEDEVMVAVMLSESNTHTLAEIIAAATPNLAKFAVPRYLREMADLPKTPTGKIRKAVLREEGITVDTLDSFSGTR